MVCGDAPYFFFLKATTTPTPTPSTFTRLGGQRALSHGR
jgi:hypothetical protein